MQPIDGVKGIFVAVTTPILVPFMNHLKSGGIQTSIHYPPVHNFSYYRQPWSLVYDHRLPGTEEVTAREVALPLFPSMTWKQMQEVVDAIKE